MKRPLVLANSIVIALGAAVLFYTYPVTLSAADNQIPIYFEDTVLLVNAQTVNRALYLPLLDIVRHLNLSYTDATALETFTIRGANSRLVLTANSRLISVNDQVVLLGNAVQRENGRWLVPVEFLSQGLSRVAGKEFHYRPASARVF